MNQQAAPEPSLEADLEADVAACGGSVRAAIRALIMAKAEQEQSFLFQPQWSF